MGARTSHSTFPVQNIRFSYRELWRRMNDDYFNVLEVLELVGFNFVPIDRRPCRQRILRDYDKSISETFRKLQWKWHFRHDTREWKPRAFGFIPSSQRLTIKEPFARVHFTERESLVRKDVVEALDEKLLKWHHNDERFLHLSIQQIAAKAKRTIPHDCVVIESDKNMGLFIITKNQYDDMMEREITTYERRTETEEYVTERQMVEVRQFLPFFQSLDKEAHDYIVRWWEQNAITRQKLPTLRPLVKVGKMNGDFANRDLTKVTDPLPYRPILSYCGSLLHPLSQVMSEVFNSAVRELYPWVLQDTQNFVTWFHERKSPGAQIHTADATNLYGSIPPNNMIQEISQWIKQERVIMWFATTKKHYWMLTNVILGTPFIIRILECLLLNTYLSYKGGVYRQGQGHPMGAGIVPPLANLLLAIKEEKHFGLDPPIRRYLDDIVTFVKVFLENYKEIYPEYIKLNVEFNSKKFLDVEIRDGETFVFVKKYATLPPHIHSRIPKSFKKNYFITQICRMEKICSTHEGKEEFKRFLYEGALKRGYNRGYIQSIFDQTTSSNIKLGRNTTFVVQKVFSSVDVNLAKILSFRWNSAPPLVEQTFVRSRKLDTSGGSLVKKIRPRLSHVTEQRENNL